MRRPVTNFLLIASLLLYVACLCVPAIHLGDGEGAWRDYSIALFGWSGVFSGALHWLANPLYIAGIVLLLLGRARPAAVLTLLALLLALHFLRMAELPWWKAGNLRTIAVLGHGAGYWLWLASFATLVAACATACRASYARPLAPTWPRKPSARTSSRFVASA